MIQRLQSLFLAISSLLTLAAFFSAIYDRAMEDPKLWIGYGLTIAFVVSMGMNITAIFLFKNRTSQITWVKRAMFIHLIGMGFCIGTLFSLGGIGNYLWDEALGTAYVVFGLLCQLAALRFINKDEQLVRSMDRIR